MAASGQLIGRAGLIQALALMRSILALLLIIAALAAPAHEVDQAAVRAAWIVAISGKIKAATPHNMDMNYSAKDAKNGCVADIHVFTTGYVFDTTFPEPCSPELENAIRWVIHGVQPLPPPSDMSAFQSHILIRFRPTDER